MTLEDAQDMLAKWMEAEQAIMSGQSYTISTGTGSRSLSRASLGEVAERVRYWKKQVQDLTPRRRGPSTVYAG